MNDAAKLEIAKSIIFDLLKHLPDKYELCWNKLDEKAQAIVKERRQAARRFLEAPRQSQTGGDAE